MLSSSAAAAVAGPAVVAAPGGAVVLGAPVGSVSAGSTAAYVDSAIVRVRSDKEREGREREENVQLKSQFKWQ